METNLDDIKHIRSMMERSSKFLSLSGISGVSAGIFALIGAAFAHFALQKQFIITGTLIYDLIVITICVLLTAGAAGFYFSYLKAKKSKSKFWLPITKVIIKDFFVPLFVGGAFCILLIYHHATQLVAASMLIFYGLALINAGARTYRDIRLLGACEILLGIMAGVFVNNGLLFWTIGFGILHIVYGIVMYYKYDMKPTLRNES